MGITLSSYNDDQIGAYLLRELFPVWWNLFPVQCGYKGEKSVLCGSGTVLIRVPWCSWLHRFIEICPNPMEAVRKRVFSRYAQSGNKRILLSNSLRIQNHEIAHFLRRSVLQSPHHSTTPNPFQLASRPTLLSYSHQIRLLSSSQPAKLRMQIHSNHKWICTFLPQILRLNLDLVQILRFEIKQ
jgi:hypothetical protein